MTLLARYLTRQVLISVAMALLGLVLLFGFFDFIGELNEVQAEGYTASHALAYVLLNLPARALELLPIACLIGALFTLSSLAEKSEFTIIRTSGLSSFKLASHLIVLGLGLSLLVFLAGEYVTPPAEQLAQQIKVRSSNKVVAQQFRSGLWAKDGDKFINIRQLLPDGSLGDIRVYEFDEAFQLVSFRQAQTGAWLEDGHWQLRSVTQTRMSQDGVQLKQMPTERWPSAITPALISALVVNPERMNMQALLTYISFLEQNQQKATRYRLALWNKLTFPLAAPVMLLLALPFGYQPPRGRGISGRIFLGILIGLGFHLMSRLFGNIGLLNDWPAPLSAILPIAVVVTLAATALWAAERR